jgi:uncharacterized protein (DUF1800 family)
MADINDIIHLLRRTEFIARPARVTELTPLTLEAAVDNILDIAPNQPVNQPVYVHDSSSSWTQRLQFHDWWIDRMATAPRPFQEKMTLFWHGHFVTEWDPIERTDFMAQSIDLYRTHALGMFRPFTHAMAKDTQMLTYLSNRFNVKGTPNENFGRELLELFTLGVGNYTEEDVLSCARAWTGHNLNSANQYTFYPTKHDTGMKTFFGVSRNWDGPEIIDEILLNNTAKRLVSATYIARKVWEFLAYPNPAQGMHWRDIDPNAHNVDIVAFARPHHHAMRPKPHRLPVAIGRAMLDAEDRHGSPYLVDRLPDQGCPLT